MPGETAKPDKPNSSAPASTPVPPTGSEKPTDADAPPTMPRGFREARPEEYGRDYIIGGAVPPERR